VVCVVEWNVSVSEGVISVTHKLSFSILCHCWKVPILGEDWGIWAPNRERGRSNMTPKTPAWMDWSNTCWKTTIYRCFWPILHVKIIFACLAHPWSLWVVSMRGHQLCICRWWSTRYIPNHVLSCHVSVNRISFYLSNQGGSQHISLINIMFCFKWICTHCPSQTQIVHRFLALFWYVCLLRLAISTYVYFAKNVVNSILLFNSWLSFSDCVVFYGDNPYLWR